MMSFLFGLAYGLLWGGSGTLGVILCRRFFGRRLLAAGVPRPCTFDVIFGPFTLVLGLLAWVMHAIDNG
ncbi:hypothetical protein HNR56_003119 [Roseospira marina]|nr:hypothetical protein [Roseospira marina]MBB5088411.1 hypothetical protein [Roseospira marina]